MKQLYWDEKEFSSTEDILKNLSVEEKRLMTFASKIVFASYMDHDRVAALRYAYHCGQEQQRITVDLKSQFLTDKEALEQFSLGEKST